MGRSGVVSLLEVLAWLVLVPGFTGGLVVAFTGPSLAGGIALAVGALAAFALMRGAAEGLQALLDIRALARREVRGAEASRAREGHVNAVAATTP